MVDMHRTAAFSVIARCKEPDYLRLAFEEQKLRCPIYQGSSLTPAILLWAINFIALLGHAGVAIAVLVEGAQHYDALDFPLFTVVATWHNNSADGFTYIVEKSEFGNLNLVVVCFVFSFLSAVAHFVIVATTAWEPTSGWYYRSLGRCRITHRWVEYTFSAPLMAIALLLIGGIREVTVMFLVFFGQAVCMTCGYLVENGAVPNYESESGWELPWTDRMAPFATGCLAMFPTWTAFIYAFYSNVSKASDRRNVNPPDWVYAIIWTQLGLFFSFTFPIVWYQSRHPRLYWKTELWYSVLSLAAKLTLNGVLLSRVFLTGRLDLSSDDFVSELSEL